MSDPRNIEEQLEVFSNYLKKNGLKMTRQRRTVVEAFLSEDGHLSADELYEIVRKKDERLGYATVFRTLNTLADCGLARAIDLGDGRTRYEHDYKRPHHHHLVCTECHRTIEFFSPKLEQIQSELVKQYNFKPKRHKVQIFGICHDCQTQQQPRQETVDSDLVFARDALKIAMATEQRGVNFYTTAAELATQDSTRKTFLAMLEEERHHLSELEERWNELIQTHPAVLDAPVFLHFDYEALRRIFPSREEAEKKLKQNLTEPEALKLAMDMEKEAYHFFSRYADRFNDTRGRDIFLKFAEEEKDHYNLIREEYERLQDSSPELHDAPGL